MFSAALITTVLLSLPTTPATETAAAAHAPAPASILRLDDLDSPLGSASSPAFGGPRKGYELSLHWGTFGIADSEVIFEGGLEYRFPAEDVFGLFDLHPIVGTSLLADGGSYVYAGARHEWYFTDRLFLAPSFAAGLYQEGGVDLGGPLEFRSGLDLGVRLSDRIEAAVGIYHLSNGGLYALNGGSESALFSLAYGL